MMKKIKMSMVEFLTAFGPKLVGDILNRAEIKYLPGEDTPSNLELDRNPFDAQQSAIEGIGRVLANIRTALLNGAMGVGKTLMGIGIAVREHKASGRKTSNVVVCCPPTLVAKWEREVYLTAPGAIVVNCTGSDAITKFQAMERGDHKGLVFWLIADTSIRRHFHSEKIAPCSTPAQMGAVKLAIQKEGCKNKPEDLEKLARCPKCGSFFVKKMSEGKFRYLTVEELARKTNTVICRAPKLEREWKSTRPAEKKGRICGEVFRTNLRNANAPVTRFTESSLVTGKLMENRPVIAIENEEDETILSKPHALSGCVSLAFYAKKKWRSSGLIHLLLVDEAHRAKNDGIQGVTTRWLCTAARKVVMLTGTLTGGYARDLFYLLWAISYRELKALGFKFTDTGRFESAYGAREQKEVVSKDGTARKTPRKLPGISAQVYTDFLVNKTVFVDMADLSLQMPPLTEHVELVDMNSSMRERYDRLVKDFKAQMARAARKDFASLSGIVNCALHVWTSWPDRLRADKIEGKIKTTAEGEESTISIEVEDLEVETTPKEARIIQLIQQNRAEGRKVLIFLTYTGLRDCAERLERVLLRNSINAVVLRDKVAAGKRETWIRKNTVDVDCLICHPELVKEGLDLIVFPTIISTQPICNLYTHRQAMARPYRPGQTQEVRIYHVGYKESSQEQLMCLIASKLDSALLAEGDASEPTLVSELSYSQDSVLREMVKAVIAGQDELLALTSLGKKTSSELKFGVDARTFVENGGFVETALTDPADAGEVEKVDTELITVSEAGEVQVVHVTVTKIMKVGRKVQYVTETLHVDDLKNEQAPMQLCLF